MNRISLAGYLGNQLFQLAYAHELRILNPKIKVNLFNFTGNPSKAENFLSRLELNCSHVGFETSPMLPQIQVRVSNKLQQQTKLNYSSIESLCRVINSNDPRATNDMNIRNAVRLGYFQDVKRISKGIEIVVDELSERLDFFYNSINTEISEKINELGSFQVIHVRRNDLKQKENTPFGILAPDFYISHLEKNLPIVCTTDDEKDIHDIIQRINPDIVVGRNDLTPIQALSLMSKSKKFIGANSTMSFWGALLASRQGGKSIFPIIRTSTPENFDVSSYFSGFNLVEGIYYQDKY